MVGTRYIAAMARGTVGQRHCILALLSTITAPFKTSSQGRALPSSHEERIEQALDHAPPP